MMSQAKKSSKAGDVGGVAPFLKKTYEMVEDPASDQVISWTETGESFVVWRQLEFARDLLPQSFKHNNFSSFVRQLNTYGFRKVTSERWEFSNVHFRLGKQGLLSEIQRRRPPPLPVIRTSTSTTTINNTVKSPPSSARSSKEEEEQSSTSTSPHHQRHQELFLLLLEENARLKKHNEILVSDIASAKKHCDDLLGFLSNYVDVSDFDFETLMKKKRKRKQTTASEVAEGDSKRRKDQDGMKLFGVYLVDGGSGEESHRKKARFDNDLSLKHEQQL